MRKPVIITGQTGTGKTAYAMRLAREKGGELISADSRQIYKKLTIVTGKDIEEDNYVHIGHIELDGDRRADIGYYTNQGIRIWGYDLVDPRTHFSAYDYKVVADHIVRNAIDESSLPIIVGGTHLYLKYLTQDFAITTSPNWDLRNSLERLDVTSLQSKLRELDTNMFEEMNNSDQSNPRRLIRKIEIAMAGREAQARPTIPHLEIEEKIGLRFSSSEQCRTIIGQRINQRLQHGALVEVEKLLDHGYTKEDPGLHTIGYKELISHISGRISLEEATNLWLTAEVQYAKRQLSFMKQDAQIQWQNAII
jgi:tRNA dimethylallyltransferase